jgi:uncharacterized protein YndB with AHSA1/START domain
MENKTKVHAEEGRQDFVITREFDLPVELLFKAHIESDLFEQWMSHEYGTTRVVQWNMQPHGNWRFETVDATGNVLFGANGTIHQFIPDQKITRTFEMENSEFDVQLEFLLFEKLTDDTSRLTMHTIFRSGERRDQLLKLPFEFGLNMAHNRLQDVISKLN